MSLHPEIAGLLDTLAELQVPDFAEVDVPTAREMLASLKADPSTWPDVHSVEETSFPGPDGRVPIRIYRPSDARDLPVLVWFHGGGWVLGDLDAAEIPARALASGAECVVVSVDYRLAPEHPFPAAFDDCFEALRWVIGRADQLGIDAGRVAVGGDSAGGNLAAVVALSAARNGIALAHQLLVYPVISADLTRPSYDENGEGYFLTRSAMAWFWDHYVPDLEARTDARVDPSGENLADLASAWVFTCGYDPLRDEGQAYADELEAAGVAVERFHQADAIHGVFGMTLERGAEARAAAAASLRAAFDD